MFTLSWGTPSATYRNCYDTHSQEFDNVNDMVDKVVELIKAGINPETFFAYDNLEVVA